MFLFGNYVQVIVLLVKLFGMCVVIVMLKDVLVVKVEVMCGYGGEVVFFDCYIEDCEVIGCKLVEEQSFMLILLYDYLYVMVGQGMVVKELIEEVGLLDVLLVLLGGGGLFFGCVMVVCVLNFVCKIFGVELEVGNDGQQSFCKGEIVYIGIFKMLVDGVQM